MDSEQLWEGTCYLASDSFAPAPGAVVRDLDDGKFEIVGILSSKRPDKKITAYLLSLRPLKVSDTTIRLFGPEGSCKGLMAVRLKESL